jgi:hypothetical protein
MRKNLKQRVGASHGPGNYVLPQLKAPASRRNPICLQLAGLLYRGVASKIQVDTVEACCLIVNSEAEPTAIFSRIRDQGPTLELVGFSVQQTFFVNHSCCDRSVS